MKTRSKNITFFIFLNISGLTAICQDLNFIGTAPSASFTTAINSKLNFNILGASKTRSVRQTIKEVEYPAQILEFYGQVLATWKIRDLWNLGAGYGFQRNNPFGDNWRNEHRIVEQLLISFPSKKYTIYNRFRFEERWFRFPEGNTQFSTRVRYQLGLIRKLKSPDFYWQVNNEIYLTPSGKRNAFYSENWFYAGLGFKTILPGHFETGLGYNTVVRNSDRERLNLFLLQVSWSYMISLHHKMTMHPVTDTRHF